ncbi:MAG: hypothetical protein R3Y63_12080 [Eubacteriales bacterium]
MNDFNKKWLTITAGVALSGALLVLITNQFKADKQNDVWLDKNTGQTSDLVVTDPEKGDSAEENDSGLLIPSISGTGTTTGTTTGSTTPPIVLTDGNGNKLETHPDSNVTIPEAGTMDGNDTGTSQTIQPDVKPKPNYTESQLKDPTKTPDGGKVTVTEDGKIEPEVVPEPEPTPAPTPTPEPKPETTTPSPETTAPSTSGTTSGGGTSTDNSNKTQSDANGAYVPGFGYIPYNDKPNVGHQATGMYENGNKVGSM